MEKDQPEKPIDKKNSKYNRAHFYDVFLGRPEQAEEIAEFVFWLHKHYNSPFKAKNSNNNNAKRNEGPFTGLDIGCGLGRMFHEFVARGWDVWGYEPDEDYCNMSLAVANSLMANPTNKIVVERKGFLESDVHNMFDMVIAINGPFYYLLLVEERIQALKNVFDSLKPGGIVFLDLANFIFYLANYNPEGERKPHIVEHDARMYQRAPSISVNWHEATWDHTDTFSVDGEVMYEETHRFAVVTLPDLMYQLKLCGFDNIQTFNSWQSRANEQIVGARLLVAAQKPYLYKESDTTQ